MPTQDHSRWKKARETARDCVTHWSITGGVIALTGLAPEEWFKDWLQETFNFLEVPHVATYLWSVGFNPRLLAAAGLVVIVGDVGWRQRNALLKSVKPPGRAALALGVAVLPFGNLSSDREQEFFSDGMTEAITAALANVPDLQVVARGSAFRFKDKKSDMPAIGEALHASYLIDGSVQKAGTRVRIWAQLVQADNGMCKWNASYDREIADVFELQDEIAQAITGALREPLGLKEVGTLVSNRTIDPVSYENYLRAKSLIRARDLASLTKAASLLEVVVARNPKYAPASSMLALAYDLTPNYHPAWIIGDTDALRAVVNVTVRKAEAAARNAINLDANDPYAYLSLAFALSARGEFLDAEDNYKKALELSPGNPDALHAYSGMLADIGQVRKSLEIRERLDELEPFVPVFKWITAMVLSLDGQDEKAIALLESLQRDVGRQFYLSLIYASAGDYAKAIDAIKQIPPAMAPPGLIDDAVGLLQMAPRRADSTETLPKLGIMGWIYVHVGAPDRCLDFYERNLKAGYLCNSTGLVWHSSYAELRKTERFHAFVRDSGLVKYWSKRGWPDCGFRSGTI